MERAEQKPRFGVGMALVAASLTATLACTGKVAGGGPGTGTGTAGGGSPTGNATGAAGTSGVAGAAGTTAPGPLGNGWPSFGPATAYQLRRLTTDQFTTTARTLLGVSTTGMPAVEGVSPVAGFSAMGASTAAVSSAGVGQFENASRFLAHAAFVAGGPRAKLVPCTPTGVTDTACIGMFVTSFGQRAFRRPLTTDEQTRYAAAAAQIAKDTGDVWQGLEAITTAFLQSPHFLYLPEVGEPDPQIPARYRFTAYEMASRLSYFLTGDMPDDMLLASAASGALLTPQGVQAQATRLLALPAAHDAVRGFFSALLSLDGLDTFTRPTQLFPAFTSTLGAAMKQETALVLDDLVFGRDGDYRRLYDQAETFVNAELAALYGLPAPAGAGFSRVTLPAGSHRAGLLGQAGVLAARDHSDGTSPTRRGLFVRTRLLCENLPLAPPANLQIPPPPTGLLTARQKLDQHASNMTCAACHKQTDPVGLSLEHFDAMGVYREQDHNLPIDDSGELDGKQYQGAIGLGAVLRDHPALAPCLIQSMYGVSVGHLATEFDRAPFGALVGGFDAGGSRVRALLTSIVSSDGFRYLPKPTGN